MAFKMKGYSAFTKTEDVTPQSKAYVRDMTPQTELNKMDLDDLEDQRGMIFNNEYSDAKDSNDASRIKLLEGRMAKLDKLNEQKRKEK